MALYDTLSLINDVYHQSFAPCDQPPLPIPRIRGSLYPHQQNMVRAMHQYRDKMIHGYMVGSTIVNGKIGVVADPAGSGKMRSILAYLSSYSLYSHGTMTSELSPASSTYFFSHDMYRHSATRSVHLIVVPHLLMEQWKKEITTHTTLPHVLVENKRQLQHAILAEDMVEHKLVITSNKCFKAVQDYAAEHQIEWNQVFIDEASSIYLPSMSIPIRFQFLWLITNEWIPLLFKHPIIMKSNLYALKDRVLLHPEAEHWLLQDPTVPYEQTLASSSFFKDYLPFFHPYRSRMVLRNGVESLTTSMGLPEIMTRTITCCPTVTLSSLRSFRMVTHRSTTISPESVPLLFHALHVEQREWQEYRDHQPITKHALIQRKVEENECMICLDNCVHPTFLSCCHQLYCGGCLLQHAIMSQRCPTCREPISAASMCGVQPILFHAPMRSRKEVCLDLLRTTPDATWIIYSAFDNIYYQLIEDIRALGIYAERVEHNLFSMKRTIRNLQEGHTRVLFVSNMEWIRGWSLPMMTHLVFFHELPVYEMRQVLIHSAQRLGRTGPLTVLQLQSEIPL